MAFLKPLVAAAMTTLVASAGAALAQQPLPPVQPAPGAKQQPAPKTKPAAAPAKSDSASAASGGESGLRQRVEQLEEQLVDLQVVIGTLESLAKSGGGAAPAVRAPVASGSGLGPSDGARLDGIETQIRALTAQVEQLAQQVRSGSGGASRRSEVGGYAAESPPSRFGSTTVTSSEGDPIGSLISGGGVAPPRDLPPAREAVGAGAGGYSAAPLPPPTATAALGVEAEGNPKQLYETAYGYLLQQDYGAAEAAFDDFLKRYPSDSLAGNAQYWLGESFFVRGQYKQAAGAFLKGYQTYAKGSKAPDSLLKLAMSLERLGQKDAACSSFGELSSKFPTAPAHIKSKAQSERQRLGCG